MASSDTGHPQYVLGIPYVSGLKGHLRYSHARSYYYNVLLCVDISAIYMYMYTAQHPDRKYPGIHKVLPWMAVLNSPLL